MQRVAKLLLDDGPMTCREVACAFGIRIELARGMLGKAKAHKQVHIVGYRRDEDSGRLYPRAIYASGDGEDAKKPPPLTSTQLSRRHRNRKRRAISSVWQLGVPVDKRRFGAVTI